MVNSAGDAGTIPTIAGKTKDNTAKNWWNSIMMLTNYFILNTGRLSSDDSDLLRPNFRFTFLPGNTQEFNHARSQPVFATHRQI